MGDEQEGLAERHLDVFQLGSQRLPQLGVERRQRLVHEKHARLAHDRTTDRDALHLSAREPVRLAVEQMLDAQGLRHPVDARLDLGGFDTADFRLQRKFEILAYRIARVERILLQHQRHIAFGRTPVGDVRVVDEDLSLVGFIQSGDEAQRRRLARTCFAQKDKKLAVDDVEIQVPQRCMSAEFLGDVFQLDMGHC